jgi:hypothetical protein
MKPLLLASALLLSTAAVAQRAAPQGQTSIAEQYLVAAANSERVQRGLPALHWDGKLYRAADYHAAQMASRGSISHQFPGEPDVSVRAQEAGVRFSVISENVAMAPSAVQIHSLWMNSPHHRDNLLDPQVDSVAVRVLRRNGELYAVEDFDRSVANLSFEEQEQQIAALLQSAASLSILSSTEDARRTCAMDSGYAGSRKPWFVMRFTAGNLNHLPQVLTNKLATGRFHLAAVGACTANGTQNFSAYNIAVLLYP